MSTTDINVPSASDGNREPTKRKTFEVVRSPNGTFLDTDEPVSKIFEEILEPSLTFRPGNIFTDSSLKAEARVLVSTIEELGLLGLSFTETDRVRQFVEDYRTKLAVFSAGPGRNNAPVNIDGDSVLGKFLRLSKSLLSSLEVQIGEIEQDSQSAFELHHFEKDGVLDKQLPKTKQNIDTKKGATGLYLQSLREFADQEFNPPSPQKTKKGKFTSGFSKHLGRALGSAS